MLALLYWNAGSFWPVAVASGLGVIALVLWWYPGQTRELSRRWQFALPVLRVLAVVALVLSLLKPTLVRPRTEEENGAVVVLVDASASMGVSDTELTPAERVAVADGLGALAEGKRKRVAPEAVRSLQGLQRQVGLVNRLTGDLEYARLSGRSLAGRQEEMGQAFEQAVARAGELGRSLSQLELDGALKEKIKVLEEKPGSDKRQEWVRRVGEVLGPVGELLQKRQGEADGQLYASDAAMKEVCDGVMKQSRLQLVERSLVNERTGLLGKIAADVPLFGFTLADGLRPLPLRSGSVPVKRLLAEATGPQTWLNSGIATSMDELKGRAIRAIVVLSDGRGCGDTGMPGQLAASNVPVYTVMAGREKGVKDLSIAAMTMPPSAFVGETVTVRATLKSTNMPAGEYEVNLQAGEVGRTKKVRLEPGGTGEVEFSFKASQPGVQRVQVSVKGSETEASQANNAVSRPLKIIQDKINVLVVASQPTWDYQYVRNTLSRTSWAKLTDVILDESGSQLKVAAEKIEQQSVICLFRPRVASLPAGQVDAIHRAVTQKGATVILVADDVAELDAMSRNVLLGELLPYRAGGKPVWRNWPGDRAAFKMQPSEEAAEMEALRLADGAEASAARWANLPGVYHYLAIPQLKPNAVRSLLVERESRSPVLVESRLGLGKVLFMGLDETWRWRQRVGERDQDRLWLELIRYGAEEPYALVTPKLSLDVDRVWAKPGDAVKVRVRDPQADGAPTVELRRNGKTIRVERPEAVGQGQGGRYEMVVRDLPAGEYEVAAYEKGEVAGALRLPLSVGYSANEEMADLSADAGMMKGIAAATGGQMMPVEEIGELPARLQALRNRMGSTTELPLWSSPYLFLIVLGCLATEWAIRKRMGMA